MIFLELVPHDLDSLVTEAKDSLLQFSDIHGINVPDIKRISNRSHDACEVLLDVDIDSIPHIRCMDYSLEQHLATTEQLLAKGLKHILLVSGDPPKDGDVATNYIKPHELTKELKQRWPELNVYCGLDPYRQSFQDELRYAQVKLDAGADGLFTQPFFDTQLCDMYCEQLAHTTLFVGISPVLSKQSYSYWVNVNKVVFPTEFETTFDYNCKLAKDILAVSAKHQQHAYIMPIKTDVTVYLEGIFS